MDDIKRQLARNLQRALADRGWSGAELARRASQYTPKGTFGRDSISKYLKEQTLPNATHLDAMAKALNMDPDELLPNPMAARLARRPSPESPVSMEAGKNGTARLRINEQVPIDVAIEVIRMIRKATAENV